MKKLTIFLFAVATIFSFTQCSNSSADKLLSNPDTRGKIISELMNNDAYMKQVMDSIRVKHGKVIVSTTCEMMRNNRETGMQMMDSMMNMCNKDTSMCRMMMCKNMEMCDGDHSKCKMMMCSMKDHPKGMKSKKDMNKCDMKHMNMKPKE